MIFSRASFHEALARHLPGVMHVPSVVHALNKIGQINRAKLRIALIWRMGAQIKVTNLHGALGQFTPNIGSNEIRVDTALARDLEAGKGKRVAGAGNVYVLGVTLLHELVHWAGRSGQDRPAWGRRRRV